MLQSIFHIYTNIEAGEFESANIWNYQSDMKIYFCDTYCDGDGSQPRHGEVVAMLTDGVLRVSHGTL